MASKVFGYDSYGRLTDRDVKYNSNLVFEENYTYKTNPDGTHTGQIAAWQNENTKYDTTYSYTYDANGNITAISDGTNTTTYVYDSANQLIRENNQAGNFTHVWAYDDAGNILERAEYAYTTGALGAPIDTIDYIYGDSNWGDKLTSYDGKTITYDAVGNPLNDGTWAYTWRHGRELSTMTNGTITVRNSYNPDGARIAKIVNRNNGSETHRYTYNGGKLVYDIIRINKEGEISNLTILMSYDESGRPFMITYANVSYYYLLNAQGDVVGIMNVSGDIMVEYTYDAWGNVLSITGPMADTMGQHNQLRYRGYVYDPETGLYFLNSRFYDPEKGRFINADVLVATGQGMLGNNMFAYCGNNPIVRRDDGGAFWEIIVGAALGGAIAGALIGAVSYIVNCGISGTDASASGLISAVVTGAATGAVGAIGGVVPGADVIASVGVGFIVGVTTGINTEGSTSERIATGFAAGVLAAGGTYLGTKIPIAKETAFTTGVTAFAGGLFMGAQTEIVNVATQHAISNMFDGKNSSKSSSGQLNRGYVYQIFGGY